MFEPRPIDVLLYVSLFLLSCGLVGMCSGCKPMPPEGPLPARTELRAPVAAALESGATLSEIGLGAVAGGHPAPHRVGRLSVRLAR
jgi:hypothetical protein